MPTYRVNHEDHEGRDLYPGLSIPPGRTLKCGTDVESEDLPRGTITRLVERGVISPTTDDEEG